MRTDERASLLGDWFAWLLPKRAWVLAIAIVWLIAGVVSFATLRRDLFPDLTLPSLSLLIQSPGRAANDLELTVAQPVEQALGGLPGVRRVVSTVQAEVVQLVRPKGIQISASPDWSASRIARAPSSSSQRMKRCRFRWTPLRSHAVLGWPLKIWIS